MSYARLTLTELERLAHSRPKDVDILIEIASRISVFVADEALADANGDMEAELEAAKEKIAEMHKTIEGHEAIIANRAHHIEMLQDRISGLLSADSLI